MMLTNAAAARPVSAARACMIGPNAAASRIMPRQLVSKAAREIEASLPAINPPGLK